MDINKLLTKLRTTNHEVISYRYHRIVKAINLYYWGIDSDTKNCRYVGSYGRGTAINNTSDIDIIVILPDTQFQRFSKYETNGQSALLQNVKLALGNTYSRTIAKGDGQVVIVEFYDGVKFEIVPSFKMNEILKYPDANNAGNWKECDPYEEIKAINLVNKYSNGKLKNLCRLARLWKETKNVNISGILLDTIAIEFVLSDKLEKFIDYKLFFTAFLLYLYSQNNRNFWIIYGSNDSIERNNMTFEDAALKSADECIKALEAEYYSKNIVLANEHWEKVFGNLVGEN